MRTVQIWFYRHAFGQHLLYFRHALLQFARDHVGIGAFQHHGDAAHAFTLTVDSHGSETLGRTETNGSHVAHVDGDAATVGDDDAPDVFEIMYHTLRTDVVGSVFLFDIAAARVLVVAAQRLEHVADSDIERVEGIGIYGDLVLFQMSAETVDFHNARYSRQLPLHNPVLDGAQVHVVVLVFVFRVNFQNVLINFTQTRGDRHHLGHSQV